MAKQYETDPVTHVLTAKGRRERNADRAAKTKAATDRANAAREASKSDPGQHGDGSNDPAPAEEPAPERLTPTEQQAEAHIAGYGTIKEHNDAKRLETGKANRP